jgi:hypothetical protein
MLDAAGPERLRDRVSVEGALWERQIKRPTNR